MGLAPCCEWQQQERGIRGARPVQWQNGVGRGGVGLFLLWSPHCGYPRKCLESSDVVLANPFGNWDARVYGCSHELSSNRRCSLFQDGLPKSMETRRHRAWPPVKPVLSKTDIISGRRPAPRRMSAARRCGLPAPRLPTCAAAERPGSEICNLRANAADLLWMDKSYSNTHWSSSISTSVGFRPSAV